MDDPFRSTKSVRTGTVSGVVSGGDLRPSCKRDYRRISYRDVCPVSDDLPLAGNLRISAVISVLFCVTVAIANDGVRTEEDASETASASNNVLREVDSRRRFGDWEGDTVHGAAHSGMIMTCVERKSGFLDHSEDERRHQRSD